ncbi:integral membrane protein [Aspergillus luchuensis]|uniref:Integral membrane protein n=1 Tax=Aspergillus kawachii TaxID=1069201 RepID=A0A146EYC1_ASPKA|nr:integral membrane protein [Aspergillus luchuensis]
MSAKGATRSAEKIPLEVVGRLAEAIVLDVTGEANKPEASDGWKKERSQATGDAGEGSSWGASTLSGR